MHTQARQLAGARGDKPSQQLATPHKREVRDIGQGNQVCDSWSCCRTAYVEVEEDLRAVALDWRVVSSPPGRPAPCSAARRPGSRRTTRACR